MTPVVDRRRVVPVLVALLVLLATLVPVGLWWFASRSSASFADAEILDANHLGAATLDIQAGSDDAVFEAENLAPGDVVTGQLELQNVGELPLRFGVRARTGGGLLSAWLEFALWQTDQICRPTEPGELLADGVLLSSSDTALLRLDDRAIALAPGDAATVCLRATLPLEASNDVQGQRLVIDLVIDAEHDIAATEAEEASR